MDAATGIRSASVATCRRLPLGPPARARGGVAVSPDRAIRVGIADNRRPSSQALIRSMGSAEDVVVIGEASEHDAVVELVDQRPDVLVIDLTDRPERLEWTRAVTQRDASIGVVVLTDEAEADLAGEAFRAGARGLVARTTSAEQLLQAVRMVAAGSVVIDAATWGASSSVGTGRRRSEPVVYVTKRELDVLRLLAHGRTNKRIAEELGIAGETVKTYLDRIFRRLGVDNRTDAVAKALRTGLVD